jgi:hypothetical protein
MQSPAFEGPYFDELAVGQEFGGALASRRRSLRS